MDNPYIGKQLGPYRIVAQIDQGGMATVYKAYQPSMDRYVALKVLPAHFTKDPTFVARFTQEARTLAHLEHAHILPVHDYGEQDGVTYLVMRYMESGTLRELIEKRGRLPLNEIVRIMGQVGRALGYAHSQGIIHRDIKPSNVLIDPHGNTFLSDFGISKLVATTAQFTASGTVIGTPAYMSPEQSLDQPIDHRSDLYSLGIMLYEMLTGRVPYNAETPLAILLKHVHEPLPLPRILLPDVPEGIERVVLKSLAKAPDDRYQSAEELVIALEQAAREAPTAINLPQATIAIERPTTALPTVSDDANTVVAQQAPTALLPRRKKRFPRKWIAIGVGAFIIMLCGVLMLTGLLRRRQLRGDIPATGTTSPTAIETGTVAPILSSGWTNYNNRNFIRALARQENYLWVGTSGGLVRWDIDTQTTETFHAQNGLLSPWINALLIDRAGNLWVATDMGLNRFDGNRWIAYTQTEGLETNEVISLYEDPQGGLWAGTAYGERGLNHFDGHSWGPSPLPPLPLEFPRPWVIAGDPRGRFFIGTDEHGIAYYDGADWNIWNTADGLPDNWVHSLFYAEDTLLAGIGRETLYFDLTTSDWTTLENLSGYEIYAITASNGTLWFGGENGISGFALDTETWQTFEAQTDLIPSWAVYQLLAQGDGLWIGTYDNGVVFYDGSRRHWLQLPDTLAENPARGFAQTNDGALWVTHEGYGLSRYVAANDTWQVFNEYTDALNWSSRPGVDNQGQLWIGGDGELKYYTGEAWMSVTPTALKDIGVGQIAFAPDNTQWLITSAGLMRHDPATDTWTTFDSADHAVLESLVTVFVTREGVTWIGGEAGLAFYDGKEWRVPITAEDTPQYVRKFMQTPDGSLWVVASGDLFHLVDGAQWVHYPWPLPDSYALTGAAAPDGTLWLGYMGLAHFDPQTEQWETFTTTNGLVHPLVYALHVTRDGTVWIGTPAGISRYRP